MGSPADPAGRAPDIYICHSSVMCSWGADGTALWIHHLDDSAPAPRPAAGRPFLVLFSGSAAASAPSLGHSFLSFGGLGLDVKVFMLPNPQCLELGV